MPPAAIGRIVHYTFNEAEISGSPMTQAGQSRTVPAIIVHVFADDCVNLRVIQDGPEVPPWKTSVSRADKPGVENTWAWPPRLE